MIMEEVTVIEDTDSDEEADDDIWKSDMELDRDEAAWVTRFKSLSSFNY
jgi:hypothetical protein